MKNHAKGVILYSKAEKDLTESDYGVQRLRKAAERKGIELRVLKPEQFEMVVTRTDTRSILVDDVVEPLPDFVIPRMGSETTYYAFCVIRQLQNLGVYVCNEADAIFSVKDKLFMHQRLASSKLATPKTMLAKFPLATSVVEREIGFPLVIKNVTGTHGTGIYLCDSKEKFTDVMELIYSNNPRANLILQEFIQSSHGKDLRVFVVGGRVVGCMQRTSNSGFKANVSKGASVTSFDITPEIEWLSTETAKLFNLDIAGIDLLFDEDGFKICEANSSPGFKGMEQVVGPQVAETILDYILVRIGCNAEI